MIRSLSTAATGMMVQQTNLDTIANNLANVNTTGFKSQRAEFQDLMYQTYKGSGSTTTGSGAQPVSIQVGLGAKFASTATDFSAGSPQQTGDPLNLAVQGDGFFRVLLSDGTTAYTRDGTFKRDSTGLLVTSDGNKLADQVTIANGTQSITISAAGVVSGVKPGDSNPTTLGQIQLAMFPNPAGLTRLGQNLFSAGGSSGDAAVTNPAENGAGQLQSGYIEGSNVQVVQEMVNMITAQRAYEINSKAIQTADDMASTLDAMKR